MCDKDKRVTFLKDEILQGKIIPDTVVDAVVWLQQSRLDIFVNTFAKAKDEPDEIVLFFWNYEEKKPLMVRQAVLNQGHVIIDSWNTLLLQMEYLGYTSMRIAIAYRKEDKIVCGFVRNMAARGEDVLPSERLIGKLTAKSENAFVAYYTESGALSVRFRHQKKFDDEFYRLCLTGYQWEKDQLIIYVEAPLMKGNPQFTLRSLSAGEVCPKAGIELKDEWENGLRRVMKLALDFSDMDEADVDEYRLICSLDGHNFQIHMDAEVSKMDDMREIVTDSGRGLTFCITENKNGRFLLQVQTEIYPVMLSIVTAVYNTAPFLAEMIDSILKQDTKQLEKYLIGNETGDFKNKKYRGVYEFILVDDGSTDGSAEILDDYALLSDVIRVIHKENGGVSSARNAGIDAAQGRYIHFVDSTVRVEEKYVEKSILDIQRRGNSVYFEKGKAVYTKKKLFSIIMAVYNVEPYIEEAIDSLINQNIDFEENVQLILVNDGSTDRSGEICKSYVKEYPNNIIYVQKENGGQASARNVGLEYADGRYVNFFDPDDTLSSNVLSEVARFFEINYNFIDMICVPLIYFEGQTGLHGKYEPLGKTNRIISLVKEPYNFILSTASSFYKEEVFRDLRFDERMLTAEDAKVNVQVLRRTMRFGYVCEKGVQYNYRRRLAGTSNVDAITSGANFEALMAPIYIFDDLFSKEGYLSPYEKELIAYELRSRLRTIKRDEFTKEEYDKLISSYANWIGRLDDEFIAKSKWLDVIEKKVLFLNLSGRNFGTWIRAGFSELSDRMIRIRQFYFENGKAHVVCIFNNFGEEEIDLVLIPKNAMSNNIFAIESKDIEGPYDLKIGEISADITHVRHFELPFINAEYSFAYYDRKTNSISNARRCVIYGKARCAANIRGVGPIRNGFCVSIYGNNIFISNDKKIVLNVTKTLENNIKKELPLRRLSTSDKKYILISDRPEKAGDNGEALFEYIMEHEDDAIKDVTYFVINKKSNAYKNLKYKDHVVDFRSREHLAMFLNAKVIYSSHNAIRFFYPFDDKEYKNYADLLDYKFVWLQHGVIKDDLTKEANKLNTMDDIVITTSNWEYSELLREGYLYRHDDILLSGLARFDKLIDEKRNIITIVPTWRNNLVGKILPNGHNEPKAGFEQTSFYKSYFELLTDKRLLNALEKYNYHVNFVLHSGFTCYENLFTLINSERVKLVAMDDFSYHKAYCESSLFITDYSSAIFDFAYLKKPVIYFQFDEDEFFSTHYSKSTYEYREDGFGPVLDNAENVIDEIIKNMESGCEMSAVYRERVDRTFAYVDNKNCKRIIDATRKWLI